MARKVFIADAGAYDARDAGGPPTSYDASVVVGRDDGEDHRGGGDNGVAFDDGDIDIDIDIDSDVVDARVAGVGIAAAGAPGIACDHP